MSRTSISPSPDFATRIDQVIDLIPGRFDKREEVVGALRAIQESSRYTAPEVMSRRWQEVGEILNRFLPDPKQETWTRQIVQVFSAPC